MSRINLAAKQLQKKQDNETFGLHACTKSEIAFIDLEMLERRHLSTSSSWTTFTFIAAAVRDSLKTIVARFRSSCIENSRKDSDVKHLDNNATLGFRGFFSLERSPFSCVSTGIRMLITIKRESFSRDTCSKQGDLYHLQTRIC